MTPKRKLTKLQKKVMKKSANLLHQLRKELANRNPEYRHEILEGQWDQSQGMREVENDIFEDNISSHDFLLG